MGIARETLTEAKILIAAESWRGAINRLYYAGFYSASAYLIAIGEEPTTHKGAKHKFNEHLAGPQLVSRPVARAFNQLATIRNDTDYRDFSDLKGEQVQEFEEAIVAMNDTIRKLVEAFEET